MKKSEVKKLLALREEQLERAVRSLKRAELRLLAHNMFPSPIGAYPLVTRDEFGTARVILGDLSKTC